MVDLRDEAIEQTFIVVFGCFNEFCKLEGDVLFIGVFSIGDDVNVGILLQELEECVDVKRVIFIIPERGHKIIVGESGWVWVCGNLGVGIGLYDSVSAPAVSVVSENSMIVGGNVEIDFKNAMAELVIDEEGFARIGVCVAKNPPEGVSDIGARSPTIVKIIRRAERVKVGRGSFIGNRGGRIVSEDKETTDCQTSGKDQAN